MLTCKAAVGTEWCPLFRSYTRVGVALALSTPGPASAGQNMTSDLRELIVMVLLSRPRSDLDRLYRVVCLNVPGRYQVRHPTGHF